MSTAGSGDNQMDFICRGQAGSVHALNSVGGGRFLISLVSHRSDAIVIKDLVSGGRIDFVVRSRVGRYRSASPSVTNHDAQGMMAKQISGSFWLDECFQQEPVRRTAKFLVIRLFKLTDVNCGGLI